MKLASWLRIGAAFVIVCLLAGVSAHAQYTTFTASHIGGTPGVNGTIYLQPVSGCTGGIGAARIGSSGGQVSGIPFQGAVTSGSASVSVPDALASTPNIAYSIAVIDNNGNNVIGNGLQSDGIHAAVGGAYGCVQPTGTTWSFDTFVPNTVPTVLPSSLFDVPSTSTASSGTPASVSITPNGGQYHFNFVIPTGPAGPPGAGSITGLNSDGASGIQVSGAAKASAFNFTSVVSGAAWTSACCDSLTQGSGAATTASLTTGPWPAQLSYMVGQPVNNLGFCGQTSFQAAARLGAISTLVTVSGGSIPTSGSVNVSWSPYDPTAGCSGGKAVAAILAGVPGNFTNTTGSQSVFTPTTYPGSPVSVSAGSTWTPVLGTMLNGLNVIWVGRNDIGVNTSSQIVANIQAIINILPSPKRYLVLSITNGDVPAEWSGGATYTEIMNDNAALQAAFPNNYLDVRTPLVASYNTSGSWATQDAIDNGHDVPPASHRAVFGPVPMAAVTTTGQTVITMTDNGCRYGTILPDYFNTAFAGEKMEVASCSSGAETVTRGYAGTTTATYSAQSAAYIDREHFNDAGYNVVATAVKGWILAHSVNLLSEASIYEMFGNQQYPPAILQPGNQSTCPVIHDDLNGYIKWPWCGYTGSGATNQPEAGLSFYVANEALAGSSGYVWQEAVKYDGSAKYYRVETNGAWGSWVKLTVNGITWQGNINTSAIATDLNSQTAWPWNGYANSSTTHTPVAGTAYVCSVIGLGFTAGYVSQDCADAAGNIYRRIDWAGTWTSWTLMSTSSGLTANAEFYSFGGFNSVAGTAIPNGSVAFYSYTVPVAISVGKLCYRVTTADNTGTNLYDIGVYSLGKGTGSSGALLAHSGPLAGTSFAPSAAFTCTAMGTPATIQPGQYLVAVTSNCSASCAAMGNQSSTPVMVNRSGTTGSGTGGTLPGTITPAAISNTTSTNVWAIGIAN
jgi:hypothetical protein